MKSGEKVIEKIILLCAAISVLAVILIIGFIFASAYPAIQEHGLGAFVFGTRWSPTNGDYGLVPLVAGSLYVTIGALVLGVPTGIATAIILSEYLKKKTAGVFKAAIDLLAGIPSVVYGFFGVVVVVPAIRNVAIFFNPRTSTSGFSVLAGSIILAIMILPTIVSMSENALQGVPIEYKEASLALGANKRETIMKVILPAAKSGIFSGVILGMGRAIGETMAVLLITGNVAVIPKGILDPTATLTGTIAMEMSYATPSHQQALFVAGVFLFVIIVVLNAAAQKIMKQFGA